MRFVAHYVPTEPMEERLGGCIDSSPGEQVIEFEAETAADAKAFCRRNEFRYIGPCANDPVKANGAVH